MANDHALNRTSPLHSLSPWKLWWRRFFIRLFHWEYWPVYVFNIPVLFIWWWNALRSRDFFFFTLTNPGIDTGGFFGESKSGILQYIPTEYKPLTTLIKSPASPDDLDRIFKASGLHYPVIAKPEIGERGWLISKINTLDELCKYVTEHPIDTLLQSYVDLPLELSIMVYQFPDGRQSGVTSICEKYFLQIKGDGCLTIGDLILRQDRAVLHLEKLMNRFGDRWNEVPGDGEIIVLENIGNHCRGTMFLNRNNEIDEDITQVMLMLLATMPGVYYGRFDMRVGSWEDLRNGQNIRVLEFNGTGSDPAHIYQPGYPIIRAYRDMAWHWGIMRKIACQNRQIGHPPVRFKKIISALILYFRYKRTN